MSSGTWQDYLEYRYKYPCKLLTGTGARGGGEPPGARGAPPINRLALTIKVLRLYIFAMLLVMLKYIACKLLTDTAIKTVSNNYPCQVVLDKST